MHERLSVNALCFPGHPMEEMAQYWRDLSPGRVSITSALLPQHGEEAVRKAIGSHKVETYSHAFQMGPLSPDEATWAQPRQDLSNAIRFAQSIGARSIYMVTGGRPSRMRWEEAAEIFAAILAPVLPEARAAGVPILIEPAPFVYSMVHLAHSLRDTVKLAELAGIGLCIDLFSSWWEADLKATIERAVPICHLVQVGDYKAGDTSIPCRAVPGDGDIPIAQICEWLLGAGYRGGFDFELIGPRIDQEGHFAAVKRAGEYMTGVLEKLGA